MATGLRETTPAFACELPAAGDAEIGGEENVGASSSFTEAGAGSGEAKGRPAAGVAGAAGAPRTTSVFGWPARIGSAGATADWSDGSTAFAGVGVGFCAARGAARAAKRASERTKNRRISVRSSSARRRLRPGELRLRRRPRGLLPLDVIRRLSVRGLPERNPHDDLVARSEAFVHRRLRRDLHGALVPVGLDDRNRDTLLVRLHRAAHGQIGGLHGRLPTRGRRRGRDGSCLLYTSPSPRDGLLSR